MTIERLTLLVGVVGIVLGAIGLRLNCTLNGISERQAVLAKAAYNPVLTFEVRGVGLHGDTLASESLTIMNRGPALRSFKGEIRTLAVVRRCPAGTTSDATVLLLPIYYWYRSWPDPTPAIVTGPVATLAPLRMGRILLYPHDPDSDAVVPEFRTTNVVQLFRTHYTDILNEEHDEYYVASLFDSYVLPARDGEALYREVMDLERAGAKLQLTGGVEPQDSVVAASQRALRVPRRVRFNHDVEPEYRWPYLEDTPP